MNSYCPDLDSAVKQARWLVATYGCPVLVEEWLPGAEVTVDTLYRALGKIRLHTADSVIVEIKVETATKKLGHNIAG